MIWLVFVSDTALRYDLCTFGAFGRKVILVARHAVDFVLFRYEALGTDRLVAREAQEAVLVELLALVLHLLHARLEYLSALVAARRERLVVAFAAVEGVILAAERLVDQRQLAHVAEEALFVPVSVLVRKVLGVSSDLLLAFLAAVSEQLFVALDTVRVFVLQYVSRTGQGGLAVPTAEMVGMKVLIHAFRVLAVEY